MTENNIRLKNIDIFRFIFAVLIVMFHGQNLINMPKILGGIKHCNVCVEFFFIISGFFLFYYIDKYKDTWHFIKKRFFRLAPNIWLSIVIVMILSIFIKEIYFNFEGNILRFFLLHNIGLAPKTGGTGLVHDWFISCLFWVSIFYFYIYKIFDKKYLNLILWIITILSFTIYIQYNHFEPGKHIENIYYIFNIGICRALGAMGLGYFINMAFRKGILKNSNVHFISFIEIFVFADLFYYLIRCKGLPGESLIIYVLLFSILFYLFLIKRGILSKLFDNNISVFLGKYAYSIYCFHGIILALFKIYFKHHQGIILIHPYLSYSIQVLCAIIFGIILYHIFEKPVNYLVKKML